MDAAFHSVRSVARRQPNTVGTGLSLRQNALDPGLHRARTHWIWGFMAFQLARRGRTLPYRYVDLTVKTEDTVLTKSIYTNTESHNLS